MGNYLKEVFETVQKISTNKNLSDIANGIVIEADNNMVNITSISMDIIVETKFKCQILSKGSVVLDGKLLLNLIRNIPDGILVTTNSKIGGIEEKINCEVYGEVLDVAFNTKYILDGLRGIDDEFVNIYFTSKVGPCSIKNINDDSYLYVVVPVNFK